ncbi:MAG: tetratricopeptide repeat protein [Sulfuriferula sp.]
MKIKGSKSVSFEMNIANGIMIGTSDSTDEIDQNICRIIAESISRSLGNISSDWIKLFDEKIAEEKYQQAYKIFYENKGSLQFSTDKQILVKLRCMNVSRIDKDSRKEYLTFLIALSSHLRERGESLGYIERLLDEFKDEIDPLLVQNLYLEKANISAINGFYSKASLIYKKVISSNDSDSGTIAWAYQGLSNISETHEDIISYAEKAADKHLEFGTRDEAVKNIIKISNIKSTAEPKVAIQLIDKCIALYGSEKLIDRELLASLKHKKAAYLWRIGKNLDALPIAEEACQLRRGLIGNEIELHASLSLAEILATDNGEKSKAEGFKSEAKILSALIKDDNFSLKHEISVLLAQSKVIDEDLMSRVIASGDSSILSAALLYQSTNSSLCLEESIELLDRSRIAVESHIENRMLDVIHFAIAEKYRNEGMIDDAYKHYKKSLECNQFYHPTAQNCAAMLFNESRWKEAEAFTKERLNLIGELPGICFAYAKSLYENRKYLLAFKYFKKSDPSVDGISDYIAKCLENIDDKEILSCQEEKSPPELAITAEQFYESLEKFSKSISADSRMHFWDKDKESGKYNWTKKPEELSKQMLITFLNGKFGQDAIEILQEAKAGAGFIDLYVLLPGGLKVVIELKMCGNGYSSTYALSGESQIVHYQTNKSTKLGYLIVFDARVRDYGKHFKKLQMINDHTIYTIAIDLRSEIARQ